MLISTSSILYIMSSLSFISFHCISYGLMGNTRREEGVQSLCSSKLVRRRAPALFPLYPFDPNLQNTPRPRSPHNFRKPSPITPLPSSPFLLYLPPFPHSPTNPAPFTGPLSAPFRSFPWKAAPEEVSSAGEEGSSTLASNSSILRSSDESCASRAEAVCSPLSRDGCQLSWGELDVR